MCLFINNIYFFSFHFLDKCYAVGYNKYNNPSLLSWCFSKSVSILIFYKIKKYHKSSINHNKFRVAKSVLTNVINVIFNRFKFKYHLNDYFIYIYIYNFFANICKGFDVVIPQCFFFLIFDLGIILKIVSFKIKNQLDYI